jgi:aryl-alcohol dehydrogenase-like predicted oxidoreductase
MYYSLLGRDIERDLVPLTRRYGTGLTVWGPLAGGFLSGKYRRGSAARPGDRLASIDPLPFDRDLGFALLDDLRAIADDMGASVAQVALAWLVARPAVTSVILGASTVAQLDENLGAIDVSLDAERLARLDALTAPAELYPHWHWRGAADRVIEAAVGKGGTE